MSVMVHDEFGQVCTCSCHNIGENWIAHCWTGPCCELPDAEYINKDGSIDEKIFAKLCEEIGIVFPYLPSNMYPPLEMPTKFTMPIIKNKGPALTAKDFVAVQPMTAPVAGIFGHVKKGDKDAD